MLNVANVCVCWQVVPELYVIIRGLEVKMRGKVRERLNSIVDGAIRKVDRFICICVCVCVYTHTHTCMRAYICKIYTVKSGSGCEGKDLSPFYAYQIL